MRHGFVIDLKRCFGCYTCQMNCKAERMTPPGVFWGRVLRGETGKFPTVTRQSLPVMCMQCADPECKEVCPTNATQKQGTGVVTVDPNLCIGCRYCMVACPYGARTFMTEWTTYFSDAPPPKFLSEDGQTAARFEERARKLWVDKYGPGGVVTKCDFCVERVERGLKPGCIDGCPAKARFFGDLDDPESEVSILIRRERGFQINPEYGTDPAVYYLPAR